MEKKFRRDFEALDEIFQFTGQFVSDTDVAESAAYAINLTVEELFTNMVKYNSSKGTEIAIRIEKDPEQITLTLVDFDVDPFDPSKMSGAAIDQPLEERRVGGLGLYLVKSVVDKVSYEYKNREMRITVVKNLEN